MQDLSDQRSSARTACRPSWAPSCLRTTPPSSMRRTTRTSPTRSRALPASRERLPGPLRHGRRLPPDPMEIVTAEKLGLSKEILDLCFLSKGLVLVTGPTGSGKSTTLCALVDYINRNRKDHIITIEDPIEFVHQKKNCSSTSVRCTSTPSPSPTRSGRPFARIPISCSWRDAGPRDHLDRHRDGRDRSPGLRHAPHTTAASTVDRDHRPVPADRQAQIRTMLASSLKGVIAQTLCKKIGVAGWRPWRPCS